MSQFKKSFVESAVKNYSPNGLTSDQVKTKLELFGENSFVKEKLTSWKTFCKQFINPLNFILIFAAVLSAFMEDYSGTIIIMTIVILNSVLSFVQEYRSGKAVEKLSELIERKVLVIRDSEQVLIDVHQLVPGDTIILRAGDIVPADLKIMESSNLSVNESQLTGESVPVSKGCAHKDLNTTLLFSGSVIERGQCQCVVYATGNQTELGKIALLSKDTKKVTQYQKSLTEFSFSILRMIGATIVLMLSAKIISIHSANDLAEVMLFTIALAMTVVPEALPMITTINLSYGALQLAKQKVIVKRLSAIEDLGRVNILCTDKTGTLTQDCLTIKEIISEDKEFFQKLAYASIEDLNVKNKKYVTSFDRAFLQYIPKSIKAQVEDWVQVNSLPFDPAARRRRVIVKNPYENTSYLVVIGSPETLLSLSQTNDSQNFNQLIVQSGKQGMRQLAIAYKQIDYCSEFDILSNEKDLIFLGFAKLLDPLRKTAKATINQAKELGITVKILTGDSLEVAAYIGKEIGLVQDGEKIYSGNEVEKMTDLQLDKAIKECSVFARVTPEQKYNIIKRLKLNNVVGYQGDGINDAPSLKLADVAVAVHNATDVAKDSADIVLLEDELKVIVDGIRYGRSIFVNINKYIKHAMIGNIGNFFSLAFFYVAFSADVPMLPIQLLIGNLIQDMPLMSVFSDSVDDEEVSKPQVVSQVKSLMKTSLGLGIFTAVYYLAYFMLVGTEANALTQTNLFLFYNFTQLLVIISVRSKNFFWKGTKPSRLLLGSVVFFMALSVALTYIPFTADFMGFTPLPLTDFATLSIVTGVFIFLLDLAKVALNSFQTNILARKANNLVRSTKI
ncbi:cation-translocating P-type ATPase [Lachnoclostridium phytofermentans]|uniref:ATPase, P-type (Transporting), HAD superfamily, subfamily IC n=1 Tax=Lachnoclostridium phytofermentans (strain ATCC 700394 / DSM 18823 / ISDg) TaxID=357809 RepID=A9KSE1_LACP7|nr:cation-transporting P-type ATPase [Lachnoclostridium phytofermentans]ABX42173.1 ATPase, P-type (transporting), HAD superfamily, subfamily IC [Lachnoclostridium phytofermentans ISDg]